MRYAPEVTKALRDLYEAVVRGDRGEALHESICAAYGIDDDIDDGLWRRIDEYVIASFEPLAAAQPYRYDRGLTRRLNQAMMDLKLEISKSMLRSRRRAVLTPSEVRRSGLVC